MIPEINVGNSIIQVGYAEPPFDMKKAVEDAFRIGGNIYIHPILYDSVFQYITNNIDKPYSVDPNSYYMVGAMNIVVTDLLPENEFRVLTTSDFKNKYEKGN